MRWASRNSCLNERIPSYFHWSYVLSRIRFTLPSHVFATKLNVHLRATSTSQRRQTSFRLICSEPIPGLYGFGLMNGRGQKNPTEPSMTNFSSLQHPLYTLSDTDMQAAISYGYSSTCVSLSLFCTGLQLMSASASGLLEKRQDIRVSSGTCSSRIRTGRGGI